MASGAFSNAKAALLLAPLVSSTYTLTFAKAQDMFLGILVDDCFRTRAPGGGEDEAVITRYMRLFFPGTLGHILAPLATTVGASLAAMFGAPRPLLQQRGALGWAAAGAAFALGHLVYAPAVAWKLKTMVDGTAEDEGTTNVATLKAWLKVNSVRMLTTDLAAWVCCVVAVAKVLDVSRG